MIRLVRLILPKTLPAPRSHHVGPIAVMAGLAMAVSLAGCGDNTPKTASQAAAEENLNAAGQNLKAAAVETGDAVKLAARDAKPELHKLDKEAKAGFANLSDAAGDAASKAGHALDKAGQRTDLAAHRAADHARGAVAGDQ